jgi:hypothetical protein
MNQKKTETVLQFANRLGVTHETVRKFCRLGMPHDVTLRGALQRVYVIPVEEALAWVRQEQKKRLEMPGYKEGRKGYLDHKPERIRK